MKIEYVIQDNTVKFEGAPNVLEYSLLYSTTEGWVRKLSKATMFTDILSAINTAKPLHSELPVRILELQTNNNTINVRLVSATL